MPETDKAETVRNAILSAIGKHGTVTVEFVKKTTGQIRRMKCGRSPELESSVKDRDGAEVRSEKNRARGNLVVEEMSDEGPRWRTISLSNVVKVESASGVLAF